MGFYFCKEIFLQNETFSRTIQLYYTDSIPEALLNDPQILILDEPTA